jgi:hypothetical protein
MFRAGGNLMQDCRPLRFFRLRLRRDTTHSGSPGGQTRIGIWEKAVGGTAAIPASLPF